MAATVAREKVSNSFLISSVSSQKRLKNDQKWLRFFIREKYYLGPSHTAEKYDLSFHLALMIQK